MIKQTQQQLSHLNQAYISGQLPYQDYRQKRGLMLDGLFEDITVTEDFTPKTVPMANSHNTQTNINSQSSNTLIYVAIAGLIACIAIAATFILLSTDAKTPPANSAPTAQNALQLLVEHSFQTNTWTADQLVKISNAWQQLSPSQQQIARNDPWHKKLTYTLKSLASEQKSLADLGDEGAIEFKKQINQLLALLHNT